MFSLRSNGLPRGGDLALLGFHSIDKSITGYAMSSDTPRKSLGGRPKADPASVRRSTIGVRVSDREYAALKAKAAQIHMTPAQWLREAALSRRLPAPPVAAINREQYAELAHLAANLNQLAHLANEGRPVTVATRLLDAVSAKTRRLRLALLGIERGGDDC